MAEYDSFFNKALSYYEDRNYRLAEPLFLRCYEYYEKTEEVNKSYISLEYYLTILARTDRLSFNHFKRINKLLEYAKSKDSKKSISLCYDLLGRLYFDSGNIEEAMGYLEKNERLLIELNDLQNLVKNLENQGLIFYSQALYEKVLEKYTLAIKICNENNYNDELSNIYGNLALTYKHLNNPEKVIEYYDKSMELLQYAKDPEVKASIISNFTFIIDTKESDSSIIIKHFGDLIEYCEEYNLFGSKVMILMNYSEFLILNDKIPEAEEKINEAVELCQKYNLELENAMLSTTLAKILIGKGEKAKVISSIKESISIAKKHNNFNVIISNYKFLGEFYKKEEKYYDSYRNYNQALRYYQYISDNIISIDLREQYRKNYEYLPKIIDEINNLIESGNVILNLNEMQSIQDSSKDACKAVDIRYRDLQKEDCIKIIEKQKKIINNVKGKQLENDTRELMRRRDHYKINTTGKDWSLEYDEKKTLLENKCHKDERTNTLEIDVYGKKKVGDNKHYILGECKFKNQPITINNIKCFIIKANIIANDITRNYKKKHNQEPLFHLIIASLGEFPDHYDINELVDTYWKLPKSRLIDVEFIDFNDFTSLLKQHDIDLRFYVDIKTL